MGCRNRSTLELKAVGSEGAKAERKRGASKDWTQDDGRASVKIKQHVTMHPRNGMMTGIHAESQSAPEVRRDNSMHAVE